MNETPLPGWLTDGLGIRGNVTEIPRGKIEFPGAQISEVQQGAVMEGLPFFGSGGAGTAGAAENPFQVSDATTIADGVPTYQVRVTLSTIDGHLPADFHAGDTPAFLLSVETSHRSVYAHVSGSITSGVWTATEWRIESADNLPSNMVGEEYYFPIASIFVETDRKQIVCANAAYGPLYLSLCRDWYRAPDDTFAYGPNWTSASL